MVEGQAPLARFEAAQRRHVDGRAPGHLVEREAVLHPQFSQASSHAHVDAVVFCLHGKKAWQFCAADASS
jgi:hypothetical protein